MNIYLIIEDGLNFCIKAETMAAAVEICEKSYLEEMEEEKGVEYCFGTEKEYYHEHLLQSCSLVERLKN